MNTSETRKKLQNRLSEIGKEKSTFATTTPLSSQEVCIGLSSNQGKKLLALCEEECIVYNKLKNLTRPKI